MSEPYEELGEFECCPMCNNLWYGECPKDPWWVEYYCDECHYGEGKNLYSDEKMVLCEGDNDL